VYVLVLYIVSGVLAYNSVSTGIMFMFIKCIDIKTDYWK